MSTEPPSRGISQRMDPSEATSIAAFVDDDERLYRREVTGLMRFATTLVGPDDAADVVSEAVIAAMTGQSWRRVADRRAYLYRVVLNQARMHLRSGCRRRRREPRSASPAWVEHPLPRPDVRRAVSRLSLRQRAVVHLVYWDGLSVGDAARRLGVGTGTVKRHLYRARAALREVLDD